MSDKEIPSDGRQAVSLLAACIVTTMNETDPSFQERFLKRLDEAYARKRHEFGTEDLEVLSWTREILTGFTTSAGQGQPFFQR
ncbi:hypothetical protein [Oceanibaculum sp.]|uniref:hypothetical protein n=1 Tax=Oceanibaculum sp. TaxID=1903597 RepID=UPI00258B325C|nr:hypothetical protein [Oceanibaculum sp.]MCH2394321.1 hypothetical protein [Oceanibaculum sp.]